MLRKIQIPWVFIAAVLAVFTGALVVEQWAEAALSKQYTFSSGTVIASSEVNTNFDDLFDAIGTQTFTEQNYVTDDETTTTSLDELDKLLFDIEEIIEGFTNGTVGTTANNSFSPDTIADGTAITNAQLINAITSGTSVSPSATHTTNLGSEALKYKTGYFWTVDAGYATVDTLVSRSATLTSADINGGTASGVTVHGTPSLYLASGVTVTELSSDGTLTGNSDTAVPTEKAVKTYVDNTGGFTLSGVTVFNTTLTAANTFQDLDIGATVTDLASGGIAYLEINTQDADAAGDHYVIKPKGYGTGTMANHVFTSSWHPVGTGMMGIMNPIYIYTSVIVDSGGLISHACSANNVTMTIRVIGYEY